ncbi:hypothetical protein [Winogradskyella vidalii]|nr:hypothetical protein [Winogradskyella vidalii]
MKFTSQLIQNQFSKVGRIFPKPNLNTKTNLNDQPHKVEQKKQLI